MAGRAVEVIFPWRLTFAPINVDLEECLVGDRPGKLPNVVSPWRQNTVTNTRFGDVIEDEDLIRMLIYKLDGLGKVLLENQDVVSEIKVFELCNAAIEVISQTN